MTPEIVPDDSEPIRLDPVDGPASESSAAPLTRRQRRERQAPARDASTPRDEVPAAETARVPGTREAADDSTVDDAFLRAARALNYPQFTPSESGEADQAVLSLPEIRERRRNTRRLVTSATGAAAIAVLVAMGIVIPISGVTSAASTPTASVAVEGTQAFADDDIQAFVASSDVQNAAIERAQGYEAETLASVVAAAAASSGINTANAFFENDPRADIQYPYAVGTSMSSGYGSRWGRLHEGIDFTPGLGAPVQAIADGVVRTATEAGGAYGVMVLIDHVIDGQVVTTRYGHMEYGSLEVQTGDRITVGTVIGHTGNTGRSTGPHMHFEVIINGSTTDPLPWLQEHANTKYSDEEKAEEQAALDELAG